MSTATASTERGRSRATHWFERWSYPCLLRGTPLLQRSPHELQIGVDSDRVLVLVGGVPALKPWLSRLDGGHHVDTLHAFAQNSSLDDTHLDWVLQVLSDAGLVVDAGHLVAATAAGTRGVAMLSASSGRVRIVGASDIGTQIAHLLVRSGVSALDLVDPEPADGDTRAATVLATTRAEALAVTLAAQTLDVERHPAQVVVHNHWSKPEGRQVDLTVVAGDTWEADRVVTDGLLRADQAHLVLRSRGDGVLVGPLVVPGRTVCLRCTDLARTDADPAWPQLLRQLTRTRSSAGAAVRAWAAATAVSQVLAHLAGSTPETYGATLELSGSDFVVRRRSWRAHPGCGCAWRLTAEWGHEQRPG